MRAVRHYIVTGRVQGVGFRAATQDTARDLGLAGWVRNRSDGAVEIMAAGDESALDRLRDWLGRGPGMAAVRDVEAQPAETDEDLPDPFDVR